MSYWDSKQGKVVRWPAEDCEDYPGWQRLDCGCCGGLQWGGDYPRECKRCGGEGMIFHHRASGLLALRPGGPFAGRIMPGKQKLEAANERGV